MINTPDQKELHNKIINACMKSDFETIQECFKNGYSPRNSSNGFDLFTNMCNHAPVETVQFLWDNQEKLGYKPDLHYNDNEPFKYACYFKKFDNAAYLILEHNIEKNPQVKEFLEKEKFEIHPQVMSVIASKDLNKKLNHELTNNQSKIKAPKI